MIDQFERYFSDQGWQPFPFQRQVWQAMTAGQSGLLHAPTGMGKTLAVWLGALAYRQSQPVHSGLSLLWLTPLRALANDTLNALCEPLPAMMPELDVAIRSGDTSTAVKTRQEKKWPNALVTTPESLTLLLTRNNARQTFRGIQVVIVDEWHELLGNKRGVQTELALARLRRYAPDLIVWGLSATLANLDDAKRHLLGVDHKGDTRSGIVVKGNTPKAIEIDALIPPTLEHFPWAGHLGLKMLPQVVTELKTARTALVFTNTRSQCELWHDALTTAQPDWPIALHHGSLSKKQRGQVEEGLKNGEIKVVICTSSLDLGVDFSPVDRVLQVGSPKGVARLLQRAGRSGHNPGRTSRVTCVPASAFELIEAAAARDAATEGKIEGRPPYRTPLDVLAQHLVSMALGEGFEATPLLDEVRTTAAYHDLSTSEWQWLLDFLERGGSALSAYPQYHKISAENGLYRVTDATIARRHRMAIGTIVSDASIRVKYQRGGTLGSVEESFIARLRPGDRFLFAGKPLELIRVHNLVAQVRSAKAAGAVPIWYGGRMPLSTQLSAAVRQRLDTAAQGRFDGPEMEALESILHLQQTWSAIPAKGQLLIERLKSREGYHTYLFPFAGRLVHEGLAALLAYRLSQLQPLTFSWSINDYGVELLAATEPPLEQALANGLFSTDNLTADIAASLNEAELAKSRFREIARIAGLVFEGYPGKSKTARQIQTTSGLIFDVFSRYDPDNPLLQQSHREVFERQLEQSRLQQTLCDLQQAEPVLTQPPKVTPLAFPLLVDRLREKLSSETLHDRVQRMLQQLEKRAEKDLKEEAYDA